MREIKFRGIRIDTRNGLREWEYGNLVLFKCLEDGTTHHIMPFEQYAYRYPVDPATVGQFTGLHDKNGKEIYEGDCIGNAFNVVEFCNGGFCLNGDIPLGYFTGEEVIGNIHDNPRPDRW